MQILSEIKLNLNHFRQHHFEKKVRAAFKITERFAKNYEVKFFQKVEVKTKFFSKAKHCLKYYTLYKRQPSGKPIEVNINRQT